jgi:hypothetical protein
MHYFYRFWTTLIQLATYIIRSRKKETARAYALLDTIEAQWKGQFQPATRRKIAVSYGIYNAMICDAFTRLHGRLTTSDEKERLIHYFICSSLFDDFTDYGTITEQQLLAMSFDPQHYTPESFDERIFLQSHLLLLNFVQDKEAYQKITRALYKAQLASKQQYKSHLPDETIREITFTKGGYSVLLCRHYLAINAGTMEEECWYRIGTIIQLTNDLFDIYKDLQDEIDTLPNRMTNAYTFEQFFLQQVQQMNALINQLPHPPERIQTFRLSMAGIYAFGLIALDQLKAIQGDQLQLPAFNTLPRKALIVDMEKRKNLVKWLRFTYKHARNR